MGAGDGSVDAAMASIAVSIGSRPSDSMTSVCAPIWKSFGIWIENAVVPSGLAAGIPVTHRGLVQGFAVISGHAAPGDPRSTVDWDALGRSGVTIVVLMGVETLPRIASALLAAGRDPDTPVASVMDAALPSQRTHSSTLGMLAEGPPAEVSAPAVTIVGDVAAFAQSSGSVHR